MVVYWWYCSVKGMGIKEGVCDLWRGFWVGG